MKTRWAVPCRQCAAPPHVYKHLFIFAVIFGGGFLYISMHYGTEIGVFNPELLDFNNIDDDYSNDEQHFTIKTQGCTISALDPFADYVKDFIKYPSSVKACSPTNESLLESNNTHIWIVKSNFNYYNISEYGTFNCCYRPFSRPDSIRDIKSKYIDDRVDYKSCEIFVDSIEVSDEFVKVTCDYLDEEIYEDFFLFPRRKELPSNDDVDSIRPNDTNLNYNIIIMGIDAVSRMNFYRTMPKTLAYLQKYGAIELFGYNKVGDNTFPNVMPLLLGVGENELKKTCLPNSRSTFDNCPFIWQWFKDMGYYTALGEDSAKLGTFNYLKVGFSGTPTDYYLYTFMHESEKHIGANKDFNSYLCMGYKYYYRVLLDYIQSLTSTLKYERLFGFFWEVTMSHDYLNYPMIMDEDYERFFINIEQSGYLNNTIIILMSDHGIRWGKFRNTKQGRIEERLPFVFILFPPSFRENYKFAHNNVKVNSKKLTTPFDLHETLMDLANMNTLTNDHILKRSKEPYTRNRGISLFVPIPGNRTCASADIDEHWCTCQKGKKIHINHEDVNEASSHLIEYINSLIRRRPQCARLALAEVTDATELEVAGIEDVEATAAWREMTLVVRVSPGGAVFEGTLRRDREWVVTGVSRLNLYGDQSRCIEDYRLKLYCYCH